jgi:two-component system, NtrC family, sensor histidine kinase HydH
MAETLFEELKRYVNFGPADEQSLRSLHELAQRHYTGIAHVFYDRILAHEGAR